MWDLHAWMNQMGESEALGFLPGGKAGISTSSGLCFPSWTWDKMGGLGLTHV